MINACHTGPVPTWTEDETGDTDMEDLPSTPPGYLEEDNCIFATTLHPVPLSADIRAGATTSPCLAEAFHQNFAPPAPASELRDRIPSYLANFECVLSKESFDMLPDHCPWDHTIELVPRADPKGCKVYPLSPSEQVELDAFLSENFASGHIHPSKSPMASPVFFIKKMDGSLCLVQDYWALNAITVKNKYPLPLILELVSQLQGAKYFTKLDVCWGFNNVHIKPRDE
jgi:hypothetical protein